MKEQPIKGWVKASAETNPKENGWYLLKAPNSMPTAVGRSWFQDGEWQWSEIAREYRRHDTDIFWLDETPTPVQSGEEMATDYDLERLYAWVVDSNRKPAITAFTSGPVRNIAREVEYRFKAGEERLFTLKDMRNSFANGWRKSDMGDELSMKIDETEYFKQKFNISI